MIECLVVKYKKRFGNRLNKLAQLSGRDLRRPGDVTRLYLALEAVRLLPDQVRE